jgi:hypothetical protein
MAFVLTSVFSLAGSGPGIAYVGCQMLCIRFNQRSLRCFPVGLREDSLTWAIANTDASDSMDRCHGGPDQRATITYKMAGLLGRWQVEDSNLQTLQYGVGWLQLLPPPYYYYMEMIWSPNGPLERQDGSGVGPRPRVLKPASEGQCGRSWVLSASLRGSATSASELGWARPYWPPWGPKGTRTFEYSGGRIPLRSLDQAL